MFILPEALTINTVKEVQEELISFSKQKLEKNEKEATLDLIQLKDLDTAGLQLLLAVRMSFHNKNCSLRLINVGASLQHLLQLTGAGEILTWE